ncbi:reverse transcriptase domain-containing protein [Tanacetum coccineum]
MTISQGSLESRTIDSCGARETAGSQVVQQTGIQCFNCKGYGHYAKDQNQSGFKTRVSQKRYDVQTELNKVFSFCNLSKLLAQDTDEELMNVMGSTLHSMAKI